PGLLHGGDRRRAGGDRARAAARRRDARGGPDRGGGAHRWPRAAARHAACTARSRGGPQPRSARTPRTRGRARGQGVARDRRLEPLLGRLGDSWSVRAQQWPFLHRGRGAALLLDAALRDGGGVAGDDTPLGFVGELHPLVAAAWDLESASVFALDLGRVAQAAP